MEKKIVLISKNKQEIKILERDLAGKPYELLPINDLEKIGKLLVKTRCLCLVLDLDSIQVDNRIIKKLTKQYPQIYLLSISKDRFHPDLKDAIRYHFYACLTKPLDEDELLYWLKCIEDEKKSSYERS